MKMMKMNLMPFLAKAAKKGKAKVEGKEAKKGELLEAKMSPKLRKMAEKKEIK